MIKLQIYAEWKIDSLKISQEQTIFNFSRLKELTPTPIQILKSTNLHHEY